MSLRMNIRLPEGWVEKKLGDICSIKHGFAFKSEFFTSEESDYVLLTPGSFYESGGYREQGEKTKYYVGKIPDGFVLNKGDFLFAMTEQAIGLLGSPLIVPESNKFLHNQRLGLVQVFDGIGWHNDFFFHQFNTQEFRAAVQSSASGVKVRHTSPNKLGAISIRFPPSIVEQKAIADNLNEAFEGIDRAITNTQKNLTNARELFESYLNTILSGQGKLWKETMLGKEIDLLTGFAFKSSGYTDSDKSIRLLRGDNIIPGSLRWDGVKRWPESKVNEYLRYQLQEGDVVLAMDRPWIKTGLRRAQISKDDLPCLLVQRTACLRGGDNLENRFLLYLISGSAFTQHVLGSQTGLSVPHISGTQIQSFKFSKPSLREQYSIIDSLDELKSETKRLEAIYQQKLAALNELKQAILQKAFTGELTADTTNQATKAAKEVIAA